MKTSNKLLLGALAVLFVLLIAGNIKIKQGLNGYRIDSATQYQDNSEKGDEAIPVDSTQLHIKIN